MQKKGKFILMTLLEFEAWLNAKKVTRKIKLIQQHHTYSPDYAYCGKYTDKFKPLLSMEAAHLERGFTEIAQNFTIYPNGMIAVCRDINTIPAGIKGANSNGVCIEIIGNFDLGGDEMSIAQKQAILKVNAWLLKKFGLRSSVDTLVYHHWYDLTLGTRLKTGQAGSRKSCPGTNFFGGNSIEDAQRNFIPEVQRYMK
jgi:hypothetical protein